MTGLPLPWTFDDPDGHTLLVDRDGPDLLLATGPTHPPEQREAVRIPAHLVTALISQLVKIATATPEDTP